MTRHIETKHKIQEISLVSDFENLLSLCTLSEEDKKIIRLHYIEGKDFRYIGDNLGYSERTIKAKHKKALCKISDAL